MNNTQEIEHMIQSGQPIRVIRDGNMLKPYYIEKPNIEELKKLYKHPRKINWADIILKQFDYPPFDSKDFDKFHKDSIFHAEITFQTAQVFNRFKIIKGLKPDDFNPNEIEGTWNFLETILYYSAQSDAIGQRQIMRRDDKTLTLYQPSLISIVKGDSKNIPGILVNKNLKAIRPEIDIYIIKEDCSLKYSNPKL
jgi:hypothetical protein